MLLLLPALAHPGTMLTACYGTVLWFPTLPAHSSKSHRTHPPTLPPAATPLPLPQGEPKLGTKFFPLPHSLKGRKRWILSVPVRGQLWLDAGAVRAVRDKHKSLFAAGITKVTGDFHAQVSLGP